MMLSKGDVAIITEGEFRMPIARDPMQPAYPVHPGEMLREEFMVPLSMSAPELASALQVPEERITSLAEERQGIDADLAYRLAIYFNMSASFWMNLEANYQLGLTYYDRFDRIKHEVQPRPKSDQIEEVAA